MQRVGASPSAKQKRKRNSERTASESLRSPRLHSVAAVVANATCSRGAPEKAEEEEEGGGARAKREVGAWSRCEGCKVRGFGCKGGRLGFRWG